jgi:peptidoglycan/xylan/chitin deacetylase (PgdA/CDA1 family)
MIRTTIKKFGRPAVATLAYFGGYCRIAELFGTNQGARIISYHGVSDKPSNPYAVSTLAFSGQMQYLSKHFVPISVDKLVLVLREGKPFPPRAVAVTFDDGYRDLYVNAYPILTKLAIPATIFLPIAFIGSDSNEIVGRRLAQADFLSWDQVKEMKANGIAFGSHTVNHISLAKLSPQRIRQELEESKARLEDEINEHVTGFAYPYGTVRDVNRQLEEAVAATGYKWAVTGTSGVNNARSDLFALRRTKVERDDGMYVFEKALHGALDPWVLADKLGGLLRATPLEPHEALG